MLLADIINHPIADVISTGVISAENGVYEFLPDLRILHFEIADKFIVFESIEQFSKIKVSISEDLCYYDVDDEDMQKCYMSMANIILLDIHDKGNRVTEIYLYNQRSENPDNIICDAVKICLLNNQTIFLDPKYYFGINVGGHRQEERWFENLNKDECRNIRISILN